MTGERSFLRDLPDGRRISAVSFGCSSLWGQASFDPQQAMHLLDVAGEEGINYFATGPSYGGGEAERRLGSWLKTRQPAKVLVSTSVGTISSGRGGAIRSFRAADMEASLTASLQRLGREQVDMLFLHGPGTPDLNKEVLKHLAREKERGRIVWTGVNSADPAVVEACIEAPVDAVMLQFNINDRSTLHLLPRLAERGKIVISGPALARAIYRWPTFVPRNRHQAWYLMRALSSDPMFFLRGALLGHRMRRAGQEKVSVALRYCVAQPHLHTSVFGTIKLEHMRANTAAARRAIDQDELNILRSFN